MLHVKDDDGSPTMASFTITDGIERILDDTVADIDQIFNQLPVNYGTTRISGTLVFI